jgi:hypothetical protein
MAVARGLVSSIVGTLALVGVLAVVAGLVPIH